MSIYPTLPGLGYDVSRSPMWTGSEVVEALSGKETSIAYQANPRWEWELRYDFLRAKPSKLELQTLSGFFNQMRGRFDVFLFDDVDDNSVELQAIGTGNGARTAFQLVREWGGFIEPILAPNVITAVFLDGVLQAPNTYTVSAYGTDDPGVITFNAAPANGKAITVTFTYYWPARFSDDALQFNKFMNLLWAGRSVKFRSVK